MRIAILNKYQNKVERGAETFVKEISSRLSQRHDVDVISNIEYLRLLTKRYDVVIPTNGRSQAFFVRLISILGGYKVIISGQSGAGLDDRLNLYTFPHCFIGLTSYQSEWAKRVNPFVKVKTIPNGVDLNRFNGTNNNKADDVVLSVGAFTKEKRHDLTIKAVSHLKNVKLIIVGGGGEMKKDYEELGKKILGRRFKILSLPYSKMPGIYRSAKVFAFPTVPWESFGIAMVEAMSANLPVVATADPIRREIVGDAGILIDPENTDEYANAITEAMSRNWGERPRRQAEKYSWNSIAKEYEKILGEI